VRLIETPPYAKNISFARLKNHKAFANGFYRDAMAALESGKLKAPDRIVVSLPPLGVAEAAFKLRDAINLNTFPPSHLPTQPCCQVIIDIKDAWPETFNQALPKPLRKLLGPILLAPMHRSAKRAYQGADKISAVGQSYLDLASRYLGQKWKVESGKCRGKNKEHGIDPQTPLLDEEGCPKGGVVPDQPSVINHQSSKTLKPMFLCYHGTDLERFKRTGSRVASVPDSDTNQPAPNKQQATNNKQPLRAVYLGAMGSGYDLETIIEVAARWKAEGQFPFQIHFAGDGPQREALEAKCKELELSSGGTTSVSSTISHQSSVINDSKRIIFHGFLQKDAVNELLLSSHLALVPNKPDSLVACPAKICELAAAGLPMLSCLLGELGELLKKWDTGSEYNEGNADSLHAAFEKYSTNSDVLNQQSLNARKMAEALFDRNKTYLALADFVLT
jgi:glycosyltransferase involved in cell wall biosynthesis